MTSSPHLTVGFDIGGTNLRAIPVGPDGSIGAMTSIATPEEPQALIASIVDVTNKLASDEQATAVDVGVGCAGIVDDNGVVRTSPNIPSLERFPLRAELQRHLGGAVVVENDATAAAWAEARLGAARGHDHVALVALGTGIGTGFVLDGRLHRGASGSAGESGHMTIVHDGIACACGRRGCWEQYASGTAYGRLAIEAAMAGRAPAVVGRAGGDAGSVASHHVTDLAAEGHPEALAILDELAYWVAVGLANLVNILDPKIIVIGGGLADVGAPLVDAIRRKYAQIMVDVELRDPIDIVVSRFASRSGAIGAALLAAEA